MLLSTAQVALKFEISPVKTCEIFQGKDLYVKFSKERLQWLEAHPLFFDGYKEDSECLSQ